MNYFKICYFPGTFLPTVKDTFIRVTWYFWWHFLENKRRKGQDCHTKTSTVLMTIKTIWW